MLLMRSVWGDVPAGAPQLAFPDVDGEADQPPDDRQERENSDHDGPDHRVIVAAFRRVRVHPVSEHSGED